jgi:hypothetical protein
MVRFCTLFDSKYATRGLVMLDSLTAHFSGPHDITVLAMDDIVPHLMARLGRREWKVLQVPDLGDNEFAALKTSRPQRELCWTAASVLINRIINAADEGDLVVYVDADIMFFGNPAALLNELGANGNILVHEHRYSVDGAHWEKTAGRFNVGFIAFRVGNEAGRCVARWRAQVIEKCELDPAHGFCGDQGYLNEWPVLYPGLCIMANIGGGVAPWNVMSYSLSSERGHLAVDGVPLVFFHYHAFRTIRTHGLGFVAAIPAYGYEFSPLVNRLLFARYAACVRRYEVASRREGFTFSLDETATIISTLKSLIRGRYVTALRLGRDFLAWNRASRAVVSLGRLQCARRRSR